jgi:hypothetical protein
MKGILGLLLGFTLATAMDAADQPHEGKGTTSMKALFTYFTCALVLVVTATIATSQTLTSLATPPLSGLHRFSLAQASRTAEASRIAPSDEAKAAKMAKQLQNPVADLISVPFQNNWDFGIGPADAMPYVT